MSDYLPPDALIEILTRLPLKHILKCTNVCKSWYSLITSPYFITTHLNRTIAKKERRLLIRESVEKAGMDRSGKEHYSVHWDNDTFEQYDIFHFPFGSLLGDYIRVVGMCNGLVCLSDDRFGFVMTMYLWNPSIRKFVTLPYPDISYMSHGSYTNSYGFGFDDATNDYKIVRIVRLEKGDTINVPPEVEVYELSTGFWRRISAGNFPYVVLQGFPQVFLSGVVHWFGYNPARHGDLLIVTFDIRNEALGILMVPLSLQPVTEMDWDMSLGVYGESLCLIHKPKHDDSCNIWVMKEYGVIESWTKQFTIDLNLINWWRPFHFRENSNILLVKSDGNMHSGFQAGGKMLSYDPKSKEIKSFHGKEDVSYVGSYMESLVLLKSLNGVLGRHENFGEAVPSKGTSVLPQEKDDDKVNQ